MWWLALWACRGDGDPIPAAIEPRDPGTVALRRLNRAEYDNTVRDLLGTARTPAVDFPADDLSHGFDNQADVLTVSPLLFEMWERAAGQLATEALRQPLTRPVSLVGDLEQNVASVDIPEEGDWLVTARVSAAAPAVVQVGAEFGAVTFDVDGPDQVLEAELDLTAGLHAITVAGDVEVHEITVHGPLVLQPPNPVREQILTCDAGPDCAREVLGRFARRAWRRPVEPSELDAHVALVEQIEADGDGFDLGIELAIKGILLSPWFLYRVELDPEPDSPLAHELTDWELASRLSYFLWSSMPDDELLDLAELGALHDLEVLEQQVARMLDDEKAAAFIDNFGGQWLFIRAVDHAQPDVLWFPDWDTQLRDSAKEELRLHFEQFVREPFSMRELLVTDRARANARLAQHYGYQGQFHPEYFYTVDDANHYERGGLLTMTGLLAALSYPSRSSPVLRGKWVMGQLLCAEPPPPPPGVEGLTEDVVEGSTLRERLEQHRADPACAVCHDTMDPIGFGMEHFDGIGAWRDADGGEPIDAGGTLPDGRAFYGALELQQVIADDPAYPACVSEKLFTWALGRPPIGTDDPYLTEITTRFAASDLQLRDAILGVVTSEPFRMRRGGAE